MKKIGAVIALNSKKLNGEVYLSSFNTITPNIAMAQVFHAPVKVLDTIHRQAVARFPQFQFTATVLDKWSDEYR